VITVFVSPLDDADFAGALAKVQDNIQKGVDGCWEWQGDLNEGGYGFVHWGRVKFMAHRFSFEATHRRPIRRGLQLDHLCRNRACVNPTPLEEVTAQTNNHRGQGTKLTLEDVREIRRLLGSAEISKSAIARRFGISHKHVRNIEQGKKWVGVE